MNVRAANLEQNNEVGKAVLGELEKGMPEPDALHLLQELRAELASKIAAAPAQ